MSNSKRFLILGILHTFLANLLATPPVYAQPASPVGGELSLPAPGVRVALSPAFNPAVLKGIKVHADNPFRFDFVLDQGDSTSCEAFKQTKCSFEANQDGTIANISRPDDSSHRDFLKQESTKLIKYFLASLTTPENDLGVNLSPYEKNRIVPESFG